MRTHKAAAVLGLFLIGCGGGGSSPKPPGPGPAPIDPSGNWTMTATDAGGKSVQFSALFAQVGADVSANSFTAANDPFPFSCTPFTAALSAGLVQNVSNFTGTITFGNGMGQFSFNTTLAADGKSFSGTYSNMPGCAGLLVGSGTFTGAEVPSTSGTWTGTLQSCLLDQQTGICAVFGGAAPVTAVLSQDDVTGNVTGTFTAANVPGFTNGVVAVIPPFDLLSGLRWQFTVTDITGNKATVNGSLGLDRTFKGLVLVPSTPNDVYYLLTASH